jgi:hypothetical protein
MRDPFVFVLSAVLIIAIISAGCVNPATRMPKSDVSATELRVHYNDTVYARYGSGDCQFKGEIPGGKVIPFSSACLMDFAYFNVTRNEMPMGTFTVDLVREGKIIRSYSTEGSSVSFSHIDEFLARSEAEPGLVQAVPVTVKIVTDGTWAGWITDAYGSLYEERTGPATLTLNQPVPPVSACIRTTGGTATASLSVELYQGGTLLNRSEIRDAVGETCVTYP